MPSRMCLRDRPRLLASAPIGPLTLVAITTSWRLAYSFSALPVTRSLSPWRVDVGGVEEVDPGLDRRLEEGLGRRPRPAPTSATSTSRRLMQPRQSLRNLQARMAKIDVVHPSFSPARPLMAGRPNWTAKDAKFAKGASLGAVGTCSILRPPPGPLGRGPTLNRTCPLHGEISGDTYDFASIAPRASDARVREVEHVPAARLMFQAAVFQGGLFELVEHLVIGGRDARADVGRSERVQDVLDDRQPRLLL